MTKEEHRNALIDLYISQLSVEQPFMYMVLNEAIRKLKETNLSPRRIENWVVKLEHTWRNP